MKVFCKHESPPGHCGICQSVNTERIDEAFKIHGEIIDELGKLWAELNVEKLKRVRDHIKKLKGWVPHETPS